MRMALHLLASGLLGLAVAGCLPATVSQTAGLATPARTIAGRNTIRVAIRPFAGNLRTKAVAKTLADVASYTVTLYDAAQVAVPASGLLVNPVSGPSLTPSFTDVPNGNGYYVEVEAFDGGSASITEGGPTASSNIVNVVDGMVEFSDAAATLTVDLVLSSATAGTGSFASTPIGGATAQFTPANHYGLALVNLATRQIAANTLQAGTTFGMTNVQQGATSGATHQIWAFSGQTGSPNLGAVAKPFNTPADGSGAIQAPTLTLAAQTLSTGNGASAITAPGGGLATDGADNVYYWDSAGNQIMRAASGAYAPVAWITGTSGSITLAVDASGNAFYSDGTDIMTQAAGAGPFLASASTTALAAANVGDIAVDEAGHLYFHDPGNGTICKARSLGGGTYATPVTVCSAASVNGLGVDYWGNVYFSDGASIQVATLDLDGYTYSAPTTAVSSAITSFAVDRAGNLYFTDGSTDVVQLAPAGPSRSTLFRVAGDGTATGVDNTTGVPTSQTLLTPTGLCVSRTGTLFFTSKGAGGAGDFIRYL